jgi:glycolate dehydrogenase FAD-binding subunit
MDEKTRQVFADIVGGEWVETPADSVSIDGVTPALKISPGSPEETAAVLKAATDAQLGVIVTGHGNSLSLGAPPTRADVLLSTARLDRVVYYEPGDLTMSIQSGATLSSITSLLAEKGQMLPLDPPSSSERTIGGVVSVGRSGPLRLGYGRPRDWVIGVQAALPDGRLVRAGGRLVKNVAGYDITRLLVGSMGTLGVITELSLRVTPRPPTELTVLISADETADLWSLTQDLSANDILPVACELLSPDAANWCGLQPDSVLCIRFAGEDRDIAAQAVALNKLVKERNLTTPEQVREPQEFWKSVSDLPIQDQADVSIRASVPVSQARAVVDMVADGLCVESGYSAWSAGACNGIVRACLVDPGDLDVLTTRIATVRSACQAVGGNLIVGCAPVELKSRIDVWGDTGPTGRIMQDLKKLFDPTGVLNPGRFVDAI